MPFFRAIICGFLLVAAAPCITAQTQQPAQQSSGVLTLKTTSQLVFMDVTVLDSKGHPVVKGLTRDDFTITEDKKPQSIFSFEPPEGHLKTTSGSGKAPETIFVLDRLNSQFEDFAYINYSIKKYLNSLPKQLDSPSELMVLGNESLEMVQSYTTSRADLLYAVDHIRGAIPYKMNPSFFGERFVQSMDALQQIALQSKGTPGRKNIIWIGHGGPNLDTIGLTGKTVDKLNLYVHDTTNLLVNSRISLFVLYPGLPVASSTFSFSAESADADISGADPFAGDINFGTMVNATGGQLFYNRNDVDVEIKTSEEFGSNYYTLTYQPQEGNFDGKFRHIRVRLRDPNLHVIAKAGYYAPDRNAPEDTQQQNAINLAGAVRSTIPFSALDMTIEQVVRHPDSDSVGFTVVLKSRNVSWQNLDDGKSIAHFVLLAASLDRRREILASRLQPMSATSSTQNAAVRSELTSRLPVVIRFPHKAQGVRVVVEVADSGRMGAVEISRKTLDAAPAAPTPEPQLMPRPPQADPAATPPAPPTTPSPPSNPSPPSPPLNP